MMRFMFFYDLQIEIMFLNLYLYFVKNFNIFLIKENLDQFLKDSIDVPNNSFCIGIC